MPNRYPRREFIKKLAGTAASSLPIVAALHATPQAPSAAQAAPAKPVLDPARSPREPWFLRDDPSWTSKLSQPQYEIQFEFNSKKVRMRDGIMLAANIWRPKAKGKFPVIYLHIAYDKSNTTFVL